MSVEPDITIPVLTRAYEILRERGWQFRFSSGGNGSLNIRSAISAACSEIAHNNSQWHVAYRRAVATLGVYLKDGVQSWEFGTHASKPRMRQEHEVFEMLAKVITRLESNEEKARARLSGSNNSSTSL